LFNSKYTDLYKPCVEEEAEELVAVEEFTTHTN
jgi:hypothetical protein